MIEKIAKIENTMLGFEDHGIFTAFLNVRYGENTHQGVGGYSLGGQHGLEFITRVIRAVGVEKWEDLKGRTIMVLFEDDSWSALPVGIKNLPTEKGSTLIFKEVFE